MLPARFPLFRTLLAHLSLLVVLGAAPGLAVAADAPSVGKPGTPNASIAKGEDLVIAGRTIFTFRAALRHYSAADRAAVAKGRILSAYDRNPRLVFAQSVVPEGVRVTGDGATLFIVVEGDVDTLHGDTMDAAAKRAIDRMEITVAERDARSDPRKLLTGAGLALAASLVAFLLVRGIMAFDEWARGRLAAAISRRVGDVRVSGVSLLEPGASFKLVRALVRLMSWVLAFVVGFLWLNAVLEAIPHTRPWGERLTGLLVEALGTIGTAILDALPDLFFVVVIFAMARGITHASAAFFDRVAIRGLKVGWIDRDTAPPTKALVTILVWLFAIAMAYPYIPGSSSQAFQGLSVLVGLMVSIGASGTIGQAAGGLILMYTRAFRVGEFVKVGDTEGTVTELGLVTTRIRTGMGEEVMLPNTFVLSQTTKNYSRAVPGTGFVLDATVTIGYDTPWRQVEAMLIEAASRVDAIAAKPEPKVMQTALSDFYVEYRLLTYAKPELPFPRAEAQSRLHAAIQDVFNEHGVQIMSPHYLGDPAAEKVVPKERWFEAPAKKPAE